MNQDVIRVVADDREIASGVVDALRASAGCQVEVNRLHAGDYEVDNRLLFERKTLRDLVISIIDGRFLSQAHRLANGALRPVIILEGTTRDLSDSGMSREAIQGALITATVMLGIPVLRARDPVESARLMIFAARQASQLAAGALPRAGSRPRGKRAVQLHILQGLPGIGPVRASRLMERFGSVEAAVTAAPESLAEVEGLGPLLARRIRWSVSEPAARYTAQALA